MGQFVALDGVQTNRYLPGPDGSMVLDVTMTSSMLPNDIRFQLEYVRAR